MTTRVISLRLPSIVNTALERSAAHAGLSVSGGLDLLLRNSFSNCQLLRELADCPDILDAKLDVRIPVSTFLQLRSATQNLDMPISVYIRKLLFHFYGTKQIAYALTDAHYTLAGRHD
jgi:hypothetical protein